MNMIALVCRQPTLVDGATSYVSPNVTNRRRGTISWGHRSSMRFAKLARTTGFWTVAVSAGSSSRTESQVAVLLSNCAAHDHYGLRIVTFQARAS